MKKHRKYLKITTCFLVLALNFSCKKQDGFLNVKPDASLSTINSLSDCQLLLQTTAVFNTTDVALGFMASDEYYLLNSTFNSVSQIEQNSYVWAKTIYPAGTNNNDYFDAYQQIYYANTVLEALERIPNSQGNLYNSIKGTALFYRSNAIYNLVQTFAMPYDSAQATNQLGVPLRLSSDFNLKTTRASEQDCYNQITSDLKTAAALLPQTSVFVTSPTQDAAYGLLARIYLGMSSYNNAFNYADLYLSSKNQLVDFNTISPGTRAILTSGYLIEDSYHSILLNYQSIFPPGQRPIPDSLVVNSYDLNDLRRTMYFGYSNNIPYFKGSFDYRGYIYSGIATDEMYLIRAECYARKGNISSAMEDLNTLLITRWKTGSFVPFSAANTDDAIAKILTERRKELLFRGTLRWTDLRRLNKETQYAKTLTKVINGVTYTLPPNDPRYAFPFDDVEIKLTGIQQNIR